jgi:hypothetical protein
MHHPTTVAFLYESISGPEGSSPEADFTYSLLDSYVTPQINEGPGFCRCKRGPVVNILPSIGGLEHVIIQESRLKLSMKFRFISTCLGILKKGFQKNALP